MLPTTSDYGHSSEAASRFLAERALVPAVTEGVGDAPKLPRP